MKPWLEATYLTSKSLVLLLVIPAGAAFWIGSVAIIAGSGAQKLYGVAGVAVGAAAYALVTWWFGSLSKPGFETTSHAYEKVSMEDWERIYYRR